MGGTPINGSRSSKLKVVFVLPGSADSGGVRTTVVMAERLAERGHDVRLLCRKSPLLREWGVSFRNRLCYAQRPNWIGQSGLNVKHYRSLLECRFEKDEIIVAVGMWVSAQMVHLGALPNRKLLYIHGATPWDPVTMKQALALPIPKIVVSSHLEALVQREDREGVVAVLQNGIYTGEYFSSIPENQRDGVGAVYARGWPKDPDTLLCVLNALNRLYPNVPQRIFGPDRRPRDLKPGSYRRYPSLSEARDIYSQSLVWIVASRSEGFSLPVLEAMACGCTVVATDCGGTKDLIVDGRNGFLVPAGDIAGIVDRVGLLLANDDLRAKIRQASQQTIKLFAWDKCISQLEITLANLDRQPLDVMPTQTP
jgi:glycosyltransferase involved in cell wall biosynthesis